MSLSKRIFLIFSQNGSKREVWDGTALKTKKGKLRKIDLMLNPKGKIVGLFGPRGELPAAVSFQESAAVTHKGSHGPIPHGCQLISKSAGPESFFSFGWHQQNSPCDGGPS